MAASARGTGSAALYTLLPSNEPTSGAGQPPLTAAQKLRPLSEIEGLRSALRRGDQERRKEERKAMKMLQAAVIAANRHAMACLGLGALPQAKDYLRAARDLLEEQRHLRFDADAGDTHSEDGYAPPRRRRGAYAALVVCTYNNCACYSRQAGELERAVEYLSRALSTASNIRVGEEGQREGEGEGDGGGRGMSEAWQQRSITHANLTAVLSALGRHEEALSHARDAVMECGLQMTRLRKAPRNNECALREVSASMAVACYNHGVELEHCSRGAQAIQWYERGYQAAVEAGGRPELQQQIEEALVEATQMFGSVAVHPSVTARSQLLASHFPTQKAEGPMRTSSRGPDARDKAVSVSPGERERSEAGRRTPVKKTRAKTAEEVEEEEEARAVMNFVLGDESEHEGDSLSLGDASYTHTGTARARTHTRFRDMGKSKMHFVLPSAVDRSSSPLKPSPQSRNGSSRGSALWRQRRGQATHTGRRSASTPMARSPSPQRSVKRSTKRSHKRRASQSSPSLADMDMDARSEGSGSGSSYGRGDLLMMYTGGGLVNGLLIAPVATPHAQAQKPSTASCRPLKSAAAKVAVIPHVSDAGVDSQYHHAHTKDSPVHQSPSVHEPGAPPTSHRHSIKGSDQSPVQQLQQGGENDGYGYYHYGSHEEDWATGPANAPPPAGDRHRHAPSLPLPQPYDPAHPHAAQWGDASHSEPDVPAAVDLEILPPLHASPHGKGWRHQSPSRSPPRPSRRQRAATAAYRTASPTRRSPGPHAHTPSPQRQPPPRSSSSRATASPSTSPPKPRQSPGSRRRRPLSPTPSAQWLRFSGIELPKPRRLQELIAGLALFDVPTRHELLRAQARRQRQDAFEEQQRHINNNNFRF